MRTKSMALLSMAALAASLCSVVDGFSLLQATASTKTPRSTTRPLKGASDDKGNVVVITATARSPLKEETSNLWNRRYASARAVTMASALLAFSLLATTTAVFPSNSWAADTAERGASSSANAKITTGGASTLQSGRTIAITRGVNLDNSNFSNQNLKGVAFQQSIVRDADFRNANLVGASFFDATLDGSNFEGADLTLANVEMAQFNRANLKDAVTREMYVSGATLLEGVKSIENTDWTDTYLRADQQKYLCGHPTAKGTNPVTGVDTRESLLCKD